MTDNGTVGGSLGVQLNHCSRLEQCLAYMTGKHHVTKRTTYPTRLLQAVI